MMESEFSKFVDKTRDIMVLDPTLPCYKKICHLFPSKSKSKSARKPEGTVQVNTERSQAKINTNHHAVLSKPSPLGNTSETCYMNSMMQALASSSILIKEVMHLETSNSGNVKLKMFVNILRDINESGDSRKCTEELVEFMQTVQWNRTSQQDAFQLLSFVINAMQKENVNRETVPPKLKILHSFSESPQFNRVQDHLALALPLCGSFDKRPGVTLISLFDAFFQPSTIDDSEATTTMSLFDEPEIILVHIQANEWSANDGMYIKPRYFIIYDEIFEYTFKIATDCTELGFKDVKAKYRLMAVVHHMGDVSGGHYITYRRHGSYWYLTNDEQVERVEFAFDIVPYIMVYERMN